MPNSEDVTKLLGATQGKQCKLREKEEYLITKEEIQKICSSLCYKSNDYDPSKTVAILKSYIDTDKKLDRMLYSDITYRINELDENERGTLVSNVESLLEYSLTLQEENDCDCRKIVVKIYDHCQLAIYQIENAENIADKSNEGAQAKIIEKVNKDMKVIEREYITILGIFASIVLAFMGGISFSSATLNAMKDVSIFRLLLIVDLLAFILINSIALLTSVISKDNSKENKGDVKEAQSSSKKENSLVKLNKILLYIALVVVVVSIIWPSLLSNL